MLSPRLRASASILLLSAASYAQLPRKGRQPEREPAPAGQPIRTLPRPGTPRPAPAAPSYTGERQPGLFEPRDSEPSESAVRVLPKPPAPAEVSVAAPPVVKGE